MADTATTTEKATKAAPAGDFAVIKTGGKQYVVRKDDVITVEKLPGEHKVGDKVVFDEVLMTDTGSNSTIGAPTISGAKVEGELLEEGKDKKVLVVKFQSKSNRRKVKGHQQPYAKVKITKI